MSSAAHLFFSVEDLYTLPDDDRHYELVHGQFVSEPPPGGRHGRIAARLVQRIGAHVEAQRLGVVLTCDTGFILHRRPDTVRAPDVAFVRRERYIAFDDEISALPGPPDIAIEVLSPSDSFTGVHAKVADYLAAGTPLVWIVDPDQRQVSSYRDLLEPQITTESGKMTAEDLLPGFCLSVADIFAL